jgi:hypothetical protein
MGHYLGEIAGIGPRHFKSARVRKVASVARVPPPREDQAGDAGNPAEPENGRKPSARSIMATWAKEVKEGKSRPLPTDDEFRTTYPVLWEFITCEVVGGKYSRNPPSLTFSLDGSNFRATLRDNAFERVISCSSPTFLGALAGLDMNMASPANWSVIKRRGRGLREIQG